MRSTPWRPPRVLPATTRTSAQPQLNPKPAQDSHTLPRLLAPDKEEDVNGGQGVSKVSEAPGRVVACSSRSSRSRVPPKLPVEKIVACSSRDGRRFSAGFRANALPGTEEPKPVAPAREDEDLSCFTRGKEVDVLHTAARALGDSPDRDDSDDDEDSDEGSEIVIETPDDVRQALKNQDSSLESTLESSAKQKKSVEEGSSVDSSDENNPNDPSSSLESTSRRAPPPQGAPRDAPRGSQKVVAKIPTLPLSCYTRAFLHGKEVDVLRSDKKFGCIRGQTTWLHWNEQKQMPSIDPTFAGAGKLLEREDFGVLVRLVDEDAEDILQEELPPLGGGNFLTRKISPFDVQEDRGSSSPGDCHKPGCLPRKNVLRPRSRSGPPAPDGGSRDQTAGDRSRSRNRVETETCRRLSPFDVQEEAGMFVATKDVLEDPRMFVGTGRDRSSRERDGRRERDRDRHGEKETAGRTTGGERETTGDGSRDRHGEKETAGDGSQDRHREDREETTGVTRQSGGRTSLHGKPPRYRFATDSSAPSPAKQQTRRDSSSSRSPSPDCHSSHQPGRRGEKKNYVLPPEILSPKKIPSPSAVGTEESENPRHRSRDRRVGTERVCSPRDARELWQSSSSPRRSGDCADQDQPGRLGKKRVYVLPPEPRGRDESDNRDVVAEKRINDPAVSRHRSRDRRAAFPDEQTRPNRGRVCSSGNARRGGSSRGSSRADPAEAPGGLLGGSSRGSKREQVLLAEKRSSPRKELVGSSPRGSQESSPVRSPGAQRKESPSDDSSRGWCSSWGEEWCFSFVYNGNCQCTDRACQRDATGVRKRQGVPVASMIKRPRSAGQGDERRGDEDSSEQRGGEDSRGSQNFSSKRSAERSIRRDSRERVTTRTWWDEYSCPPGRPGARLVRAGGGPPDPPRRGPASGGGPRRRCQWDERGHCWHGANCWYAHGSGAGGAASSPVSSNKSPGNGRDKAARRGEFSTFQRNSRSSSPAAARRGEFSTFQRNSGSSSPASSRNDRKHDAPRRGESSPISSRNDRSNKSRKSLSIERPSKFLDTEDSHARHGRRTEADEILAREAATPVPAGGEGPKKAAEYILETHKNIFKGTSTRPGEHQVFAPDLVSTDPQVGDYLGKGGGGGRVAA